MISAKIRSFKTPAPGDQIKNSWDNSKVICEKIFYLVQVTWGGGKALTMQVMWISSPALVLMLVCSCSITGPSRHSLIRSYSANNNCFTGCQVFCVSFWKTFSMQPQITLSFLNTKVLKVNIWFCTKSWCWLHQRSRNFYSHSTKSWTSLVTGSRP